MNNKIGIIIAREYKNRVSKKSFIILTLLMPFLMVALVSVPIALGMIKDDAQKHIVVVDQTNHYAPCFRSDSVYLFSFDNQVRPEYRSDSTDVQAVVLITADLTENPKAACIYSTGEIQHDLQVKVENILEQQIHCDKLEKYNVPQLDNIIADMQQGFSVQTVKWSEDGSEAISSSDIATGIGFLFTFLMYMFVMAYGSMVMSGVMEEKTNRIMEVMVGCVKPFQLMMGKIIGVLFVGLTQMFIWGALLFGITIACALIFGGDIAAEAAQSSLTAQQVAAAGAADPMASLMAQDSSGLLSVIFNLPIGEICLMFVLYFFGGYLLYASFFAACGAAVNAQEDSGQFMMPMILIMVFAMYAAMGSIENTNGPLAFWASLFPLTSPIVMMVRIPFGVPLWEELVSIVILYATALAFVWVGGRIYRVGILMYGKKPSFKDMWKWLRY